MTYALPLTAPPRIVQAKPELCWAAALESWLKAVSSPQAYMTQSDIDRTWNGGTGKGMEPDRFNELSSKWGMQCVIISEFPHAATATNLLKQCGHLYVSYNQKVGSNQPMLWHSVVLYGVNSYHNEKSQYVVMDPDGDAAYPTLDLRSEFMQLGKHARVLYGWKRVRHG